MLAMACGVFFAGVGGLPVGSMAASAPPADLLVAAMSEPIFIRQTDGCEAEGNELWNPHTWLEEQVRIGREQGATFFRASHDESRPPRFLIEGWIEQPDDQGPLRFTR